MLSKMIYVLENLEVNEKQIQHNINLSKKRIQSREKSYDLIQKIAQKSFEEKIDFEKACLNCKEIPLLKNDIKKCFKNDNIKKQIKIIYKRLMIL